MIEVVIKNKELDFWLHLLINSEEYKIKFIFGIHANLFLKNFFVINHFCFCKHK